MAGQTTNGLWTTATLAEVATIERDAIQPESITQGTRYVGLEHIETGGRIVAAKSVNEGELASTKFKFTDRHVLYGKLRPYLAKIVCPDFSGICSTDILPILPGPRLDRRFLCYFLRQPAMIEHASSRSAGANLPRISPEALARFKIPLPPLTEQHRIAAVLDCGEGLRSKRRVALAHLDILVRSIFLDLFGDPAANPKQWPVRRLGELICDGPQNGLYKPSSDYGSGTPILRIDAFYDGVVSDISTLKRVRLSEVERAGFALTENDVVINRVNSLEYLGKCALIPSLPEPIVFESNMMRFRLNLGIAHPRFISQFLQSEFIKSQIQLRAKRAVNQASINQQDVADFRVYVPPIEIQGEFADRVAAVERLREKYLNSLTETNALVAALQHHAFSRGI